MEKKTEKETRKQNQNSLQSYKERSSKGFTPRLLAILLTPLVIIAIVEVSSGISTPAIHWA